MFADMPDRMSTYALAGKPSVPRRNESTLHCPKVSRVDHEEMPNEFPDLHPTRATPIRVRGFAGLLALIILLATVATASAGPGPGPQTINVGSSSDF